MNNSEYPRKSHQTKGRFLIGDVLKLKDGSVGVVKEVSYNKAQEDPWYCNYSLGEIEGFQLAYNAWWQETDVKDFILGTLHALEEWRQKYGKQKFIK